MFCIISSALELEDKHPQNDFMFMQSETRARPPSPSVGVIPTQIMGTKLYYLAHLRFMGECGLIVLGKGVEAD